MKDKNQLLVIDDDALTLDCFRLLFPKGQANVRTAKSATEGLRLFAESAPDAVVLDVRLPDLSGLDAFRRIHAMDAKVPIILITGHGTAETAIDAMRLGAYDYVLKPIDPAQLREIITRAFEVSHRARVPAKLVEPGPPDDEADLLIGNCPAMQEVYKSIGRVAPQDVTVLILGESGTGKELVARAIYHYSKRDNGPFLAINCAAIPETLLESELFGHEKGAFTGADRKRIGKFEQCNGGTLFLDEIGDMTSLTQAKVLRVLQNKQFERVGGDQLIQADVRIIAATNQDLETRVGTGTFRADLFYRLNVFTVKLPPLRDRGEDLHLLAEHFLRRFNRELDKDLHTIAPDAQALLSSHSWPGNVRELQSVLKQSILHSIGTVLTRNFLPPSIRGENSDASGKSWPGESHCEDLNRFVENRIQGGSTNLHSEFQAFTERQLFLQVLRHTNNNLSQACRILGISRPTLRTKLGLLGVSVEHVTSVSEKEPS